MLNHYNYIKPMEKSMESTATCRSLKMGPLFRKSEFLGIDIMPTLQMKCKYVIQWDEIVLWRWIGWHMQQGKFWSFSGLVSCTNTPFLKKYSFNNFIVGETSAFLCFCTKNKFVWKTSVFKIFPLYKCKKINWDSILLVTYIWSHIFCKIWVGFPF